ncbi:MAG: hypothetical protein AB7G75_19385, partial [Candidatus Binatia bacterium]
DFPAVSTAPGLTFRYDPATQLFERSTTSLGPVFVERARTIGQGKFEVGASYIYIDFTELDGRTVDGLFLPPRAGGSGGSLTLEKFNLRQTFVPLFVTYGITDRWDVNVLVPIISSDFNTRVSVGFFGSQFTFSTKNSGVGVGDVFLRTKYRLFGFNQFNTAVGLNMRFPLGDERDLRSKGDYIVEPFVTLSQEYDRFDFHLATGLEVNADDSDRSRVRYSGGFAVDLLRQQLALTVDLLGNSNLKTDNVVGRVPSFGGGAAPGLPGVPMLPQQFVSPLKTNIIDLGLGLKASIGPFTGFFTAFLPITDDGLRADWIPAVGIQMSF